MGGSQLPLWRFLDIAPPWAYALGGMLLLSGEGRFFYANVDWQVRFAVLRDMGQYP